MIKSIATFLDDPIRAERFLGDLARDAHDLGASLDVTVLTAAPMAGAEFGPLGTLYYAEADLDHRAQDAIAAVRSIANGPADALSVKGVYGDINWLAHDMHKTDDIVDLFVIGPSLIWQSGRLRRHVVENLLLGAGTPLLLLPALHRLPRIRRATLGWRQSAEAIRVARDLIALAEPGATIDIVTVGEAPGDAKTDQGRGMADFLDRHDFLTQCHRIDDGRPAAEQLQDFALKTRADLLATGGFGHSRLREIILGGVTRSLMSDPRLPVLMAR